MFRLSTWCLTFALALAATPSYAQAPVRVIPADYGYGQGQAASGPVIDLRDRLTPAPKPALRAPQPEVPPPPAPRIEQTASLPTTPSRTGIEGIAGWYERADGLTASGESFDAFGLSAANGSMTLSSLAMVTNFENGKEVIVRVNDRAPAEQNDKLIVVSPLAADYLGFKTDGQARVRVRYLGPAPTFITSARPPGVEPVAPVEAAAPAPAYVASYAPAVPETPRGEGAFVVQIGAFSAAANAERVRAVAEGAGPVSIVPAEVGGRTIYRVRLGPWADRAGAEDARKKAVSMGFDDARVTSR